VSNPKTREVLATSDSKGSACNAARKRSKAESLTVRVDGMGAYYVYENGRCVASGRLADQGEHDEAW